MYFSFAPFLAWNMPGSGPFSDSDSPTTPINTILRSSMVSAGATDEYKHEGQTSVDVDVVPVIEAQRGRDATIKADRRQSPCQCQVHISGIPVVPGVMV